MLIRSMLYLLATFIFSSAAVAAEQTYIREYTYQASEADSKITARAITLQEVKRELLSELGTHVSALVKQQSSSDGRKFGTVEIETLSAGVTSVQILDEKWNGSVYVLKAQIKADPADVLKSLNKMLDVDAKQKQISQLADNLSKVSGQNIQIAESLTQSKKETDAALAEIARLKKQLEEKQTDASRQALQADYQEQTDKLTLKELFDSGIKQYGEGHYTEALRLYQKAAEQGDAQAQFYLGVMYLNGQGVSQNDAKAVEWWQKATDQGNAYSQNNLGAMYSRGRGVPQNYANAVVWYQKAADQGVIEAQNNLAKMYFNGLGVPKSYAKAAAWLQRGADNGDARSQDALAAMYINGLGVSQNDAMAARWYQKAAEQGVADAQYNLGLMYASGHGVTPSYAKSVEWFQKAADQGDASAQKVLSLLNTRINKHRD
jgi:TPR repeat protein